MSQGLKKKLIFCLSSFSGFIIDYLLFTLLVTLLGQDGIILVVCNVTARIVSGTYNYFINCKFAFREKPSIKSAAKYAALALIILAINTLVLELFVDLTGLGAYIAKIATEIILFIGSYLVQNFLIFPTRRNSVANNDETKQLDTLEKIEE